MLQTIRYKLLMITSEGFFQPLSVSLRPLVDATSDSYRIRDTTYKSINNLF